MAKPGREAKPAKSPGKPSPGGTKRKGDAGSAAAPPAAKRPRAEGKPVSKPRPSASEGPKKQLTTKEKREVIREKKMLHKKNWSVIQEAVHMWEKLRPKETPEAERKQLVTNILKKVSGKLVELSGHHTASRVMQFCVKYGGDAERKTIMEQVRANIVELSKMKYGHFMVRKLINAAKKDEVPGLVKLFRGHVAIMLRQPYGADVITDLYDVASTADRNAMCSEFYGKEFVLFGGLSGEAARLHSLKQLMAAAPPAKQRAVVQHMTKALQPIMEKALLHPPMTHRLVRDFLECASGMSIEEAVETLSQTGEAVLRMVHTHEGAAAACMVLGYGSPRDRKRLVRAMKGHVAAMAGDEWGHAVLCMALGCVDDTALTGKVLVPELKEYLDQAVHHAPGVRVLLQLLTPGSRRHFPPAILEMLNPPQRTVRGGTGKSVTGLEGEEDEALDFDGGPEVEDADGEELFAAAKAKGKAKGKQGQKGKGQDAKGGKKRSKAEADEEEEDAAAQAGGEEGAAGEQGAGEERVLGASKKDPVQRRKELLGSGPKSLSAALTSACAAQAGALLRAPHSCELVVEVARGGDTGVLHQLDASGVAAVHEALVAEACVDPEDLRAAAGAGEGEEDDEAGPGPGSVEHVLLGYYSSRSLRRLVLAAADDGPDSASAAFVSALWTRALRGSCKRWVGTHCEKVLAALLHCGVAEVVAGAGKELKPLIKEPLEAWSGRFVGPKGGHGQAKGQGEAGGQDKGTGKAAGKGAKGAAGSSANGAGTPAPAAAAPAADKAAPGTGKKGPARAAKSLPATPAAAATPAAGGGPKSGKKARKA